MKTELTIEQSQRLIERGVNPILASGLAKDPVSQWELPVFTLIDIAKLCDCRGICSGAYRRFIFSLLVGY